MTDINEIIGRAVDGMSGVHFYDEIGAAVVKALGEAGYEITEIEPAEIHLTEQEKNRQMRAAMDRVAALPSRDTK